MGTHIDESIRKKIEEACRQNAVELYHYHVPESERQEVIDEYTKHLVKGATIGYSIAQEEFKQSEEKQTIKLYVKDQSQQGQNPTDPKESGEVEKPVVSMYDPPAEITYIQVNGKEYVPIDPNQDELWEELDNTCTDANCNLIITEAKKRYRITRVTS